MADPRKAALEIDRLKGEVAELKDKVKRRNDRITYLDNKRSKLENENQRLLEQRKLRTYPGFQALCEHDPEYQDIFDEAPGPPQDGYISSLAGLVRFWPSSAVIEPVVFHKRWRLSKIVFPADYKLVTGERHLNKLLMDDEMETDTNEEAQNNLGDLATIHSIPGGVKPEHSLTPEGTSQLKEPRRDSLASRMLDNAGGRKRRYSEMEPGYRRKSVCVRCWERRELCTFDPQCKNCRDNGVQCIRKLCSEGEDCDNRRCPCLHPGEWDENNSQWTVQGGRLPRLLDEGPRPEGRARPFEGDYYRPGRDD